MVGFMGGVGVGGGGNCVCVCVCVCVGGGGELSGGTHPSFPVKIGVVYPPLPQAAEEIYK